MTLQVLVSTMYQSDYSLIKKMNIHSDAIIINQCDNDSTEKIELQDGVVTWINTTERGVGRSRNRAIIASDADVLIFADDDVVYEDDYKSIIMRTFEENPKIDLITFNLESLNPNRPEMLTIKDYNLKWYNCLKFGAFRIAVRRQQLFHNNIFFSLLFGGGTIYQAGEDNLFITQCLKVGLRGLASANMIGTVAQEESTWFRGYDEKYYQDKGALFRALYGKKALVLLVAYEIREVIRGKRNCRMHLKNEMVGMMKFRKKQLSYKDVKEDRL